MEKEKNINFVLDIVQLNKLRVHCEMNCEMSPSRARGLRETELSPHCMCKFRGLLPETDHVRTLPARNYEKRAGKKKVQIQNSLQRLQGTDHRSLTASNTTLVFAWELQPFEISFSNGCEAARGARTSKKPRAPSFRERA